MKLASNGVVNTPSLSHITSTKLSIKLEQDNRQNGEHNSPFSIIQGFPLLREYALNRRIDLLDIKVF